jgi:hypothetical protein
MSAILEAYWNLSAKRFTDSCCMLVDKEVLGRLPGILQDAMYQFIRDDKKLEVVCSLSVCVFVSCYV